MPKALVQTLHAHCCTGVPIFECACVWMPGNMKPSQRAVLALRMQQCTQQFCMALPWRVRTAFGS
eukprot:11208202-Alexandrium_andersonii.AAC.1